MIAKKSATKARERARNTVGPSLDIAYILIILAYVLIAVLTPNLQAIDTNAPKFLTLSLLNLVSWIFLLSRKDLRADSDHFLSFFRNRVGLAYTLFMAILLISFASAINIPEALLTYAKYVTTFAAAYNLSIILRLDKRYLKLFSIAIVLVLITDSFTVFYNIQQYIKGIGDISTIMSMYSNKNILTAAIFLKIPFSLWLFSFEKGWLKKLGLFTLFIAFLALFFMSTRTFYVGLILLTITYSAYIVILYYRNKTPEQLKTLGYYFGALVLAVVIFSLTQSFLYPQAKTNLGVSVTERLSTISDEITTGSGAGRLDSWKRSVILFKEYPLLGVGPGNWKIQVLKYENPSLMDFVYMYHNHNDFMEVTNESGIFGGLLFLSIFVLLALNFLFAFFKPGAKEESYKYFFIPAFGVFCYSFDAFFNFPSDRPEVLSIFALFIGAGIAFSGSFIHLPSFLNKSKSESIIADKRPKQKSNNILIGALSSVFILFLLASSYVLMLNFQSSKLQRLVVQDLKQNKLRHPSSLFLEGYPAIPNVSSLIEPLAVNKSRYLIEEGKFQQAIDILRTDKASPYDSRREFFMAMAFIKKGNNDSALAYVKKAYALKPYYFKYIEFIYSSLRDKGKGDEAIEMFENYLAHDKKTNQAWLRLTSLYWGKGDYTKAVQMIDTAAYYLPKDTAILRMQNTFNKNAKIIPYQKIYSEAIGYFNQKKYAESIKAMNEFISKEPGVATTYSVRAFSYYFVGNYKNCMSDIESSLARGNNTAELIDLRGICYYLMGNKDAACKDFQEAKTRGNPDAVINSQKFCGTK